MTETNHILYGSVFDKNGDQYSQATLTPTDDTQEKIVLAKPYVIPILFIPGIMGTNLRSKKDKKIRPADISIYRPSV